LPGVCGIGAEVSAMGAESRATDAGANAAGKTIAVVRIATGIIFFLFAEYKIAGADFTPVGFEHWVGGWVEQGQVVGFYKPVLVKVALAHPEICARLVAWGEMAIAISLIFGVLVRAASIGGGIMMMSFILSTWFAPGHGAPMWQYFGANLDHIPLLFLFVIFYATRAGDVRGWDGRRKRTRAQTG
jgi:thiosulfate dehydrogenase [quinone] large subunit